MTTIIECGDAPGDCAQNHEELHIVCGDNGIGVGSKPTDGRLTFVGFDSAWAGNPKLPGAVCAVTLVDGKPITFSRPILATFDEALACIAKTTSDNEFTLVALDQPTIVSNPSGMRPVERVVASLISWLGGAVQPANRGRIGMFCDAAPVWKFRKALGATDDPEQARIASQGRYIIEVFPALALAAIAPECFGRLKGARYNPARKKTFRPADWIIVARAAAADAERMNFRELAQWCSDAAEIKRPQKADQDRLDSVILLIGRSPLAPAAARDVTYDRRPRDRIYDSASAANQRGDL